MSKLKPPEELCFSNTQDLAEQWRLWSQEMRLYLKLSMKNDSEEDKCNTFLYIVGRKGREIFNTWTIPAAEQNKIDVLFTRFEQYCIPKRNVTLERYCFNSRSQESHESLDQYLTELKRLAQRCNFGALEDEMIRDRLVVGISNKVVKERMLREPELTLHQAVTICRADEESQKGLNIMKNDDTDMVRQSHKAKSKDLKQRLPKSDYMKQKQRNAKTCGRCGKVHGARECPAYGKTCHLCKKKNHFSKMCRASVREVEHSDDETPEFHMDAVIKQQSQPWNVTLNICNTPVKFKVDTGADVTCITKTTFDQMKNKPKLRAVRNSLTSPGGKIQTEGQFLATVHRKGKSFEFRVVVLANAFGNNLLSRDVAEKMSLVKRLEETTMNMKTKEVKKVEYTKDIFGTTGLMATKPVKIVTKENAEPYCLTTARRVPFPLEKQVEDELNRMEQDGIIKKIHEPTDWCAPMVPVVKRNKTVRICVDFKKLNLAVKRPHCMLPNLEDIAPKLAGAEVFSTLDASSGFFQIPLEEESMKLTTFITPLGRYCFTRVPMGISLGPEVFQTKMTEMLQGLSGCEVIMDDSIVFGSNIEEHDKNLEAVLERIEKSGLKLNREKCQFRKEEVKYFGHLINKEGVRPNPEKVQAIRNLQTPKSLTELRTVCGMFNYMTKFVQNLASLMKPITDLLKKSSKWMWEEDQEKAFNQVKEQIAKATTLGFYDSNRKTIVSADSSSYGLGAVLLQEKDDKLVPIAFASRTLTDTEKGYAQIEKECLASVYACEKFEKYLIGLDSFELQTDHKPLVPLMTNKDIDRTPARCQRLLMRLLKFNAHPVHVPGKELVLADALSRGPQKATSVDQGMADHIQSIEESWPITTPRLKLMQEETQKDEELQVVQNYIENGWPQKVKTDLQKYQQAQGDLSIINGLVTFNSRIVIPKSQRSYVLRKLHESHLGIEKCRQNAQASVWWPGMTKEIKEMITNCPQCREHRPSQRSEPLKPTKLPERAWQKIGVDLCSHGRSEYLVTVDYYSKWIEVQKLHSTTAKAVIGKLAKLFAGHGIPETIVSDNGPQFSSGEFHDFAREFDFTHVTSSPHFPQANGQAESAVKIAKKMLRQKSLEIALMNYRATVHQATGQSPAVMLMGRQIRTKVPTLPTNLTSKSIDKRQMQRKDENRKGKYKTWFDKRQGSRSLPSFKPGQKVLMKTNEDDRWSNPGTIITAHPDHRSYQVQVPHSNHSIRRNRKHLQAIPDKVYHQLNTQNRYQQCQYSAFPNNNHQQPDNPTRLESDALPTATAASPMFSEDFESPPRTRTPPQRPNTRSTKGYIAEKPIRYREEEMNH